jgi:methylmalonyl-CoA mutase N-terminal domain/subunit
MTIKIKDIVKKFETIAKVRGTVQADILKEDQAQNTCIFSTEFALRLMGDVQEYFINKNCNSLQGFLYSKALSLEKLNEYSLQE